ncbi:MAG: hypothetical protein KDB27_32650 [Planctomycetales bacterium]|nr:hypothetical protein [Planctomycetales bacterium]
MSPLHSTILIGMAIAFASPIAGTAYGQRKIQSFKDVETIVSAHFQSIKDFERGDLITQSQVQQLFARLHQFGWQVADQKEITDSVLGDGDFLVKTFKTPKGRTFLKTISGYKDGIDRVDRMSRMPNGQKNVADLVYKIPNGTDWIKSMTSQKNGQQLSRRMAQTRHGKDFNKPTGKIYQLDKLVKRLSESYAEAQTRTVINRTRR